MGVASAPNERGWDIVARTAIVSLERIESQIFLVRGYKVMLSPHLADLYQVEPRVLVQAVKRNIERFPDDSMFQLSDAEFEDLKSQIVISSWGGVRRAANRQYSHSSFTAGGSGAHMVSWMAASAPSTQSSSPS
jgi:hypothetical protein